MALCCRYRGRCIFDDLSLLCLNLLKKSITFLILFLTSFLNHGQCAMCRAVLESEVGQNTAEGVNNGIIYLMLIPYLIVGGLVIVSYRYFKNFTKKN